MRPGKSGKTGMLAHLYQGKRVFVTGHTGFKGSWLCEWLLQLGAEVTGYSLRPPTDPALFDQLELESRLRHFTGDIRDAGALQSALAQARPDFVFHLAAQPLVTESYVKPTETFDTNVMGTVHLLDALRLIEHPCAAVLITTDKCYENREWVHGYREEDPLGGYDPYSASKAAAELVISSYRRSFFQKHAVKIASARAGNVIGGGDWAVNRIVPDCVRALQRDQPIVVRNRKATRPWQHVLEPLSGYLWLASRLAASSQSDTQFCSAFNFGPGHDANRTVADLVQEVLKHWPGRWEDRSDPQAVHEARLLQLSTDKAYALLEWTPVWTFADAVRETVEWYRETCQKPGSATAQALMRTQIAQYIARARELGAVTQQLI
jgi:CDP-glucose 4,6-dehydratase